MKRNSRDTRAAIEHECVLNTVNVYVGTHCVVAARLNAENVFVIVTYLMNLPLLADTCQMTNLTTSMTLCLTELCDSCSRNGDIEPSSGL